MKQQRTASQLMKHYFFIMYIPPLLSLLIIMGINLTDSEENIYTRNMAEKLMKDDYESIETGLIEAKEGGLQVVDLNYRIVRTVGHNPFSSDQLTPGELTEFLVDSHVQKYIITVDYNEKENFWLIVSLPNRIRFIGTFRLNLNLFGCVLFAAVYLLVILLSTFAYARITAARFIRPLRQLSDAVRKVRNGDYSARVPVGNNKEFSELERSFNHMAEQIENQINVIEQSERNRKSLMLDISHDLKNPLMSIMGYAEQSLKKQEYREAEQGEYARIIYENSVRANELIMDLFELSRLDSPEFKLELTTEDFSEYIRNEMIRMLPELEAAGLVPEFAIPEEDMLLRFDKKRMRRVLSNLLYNAIAYHEPGSRFEIRLDKLDNGISLMLVNDRAAQSQVEAVNVLEPYIRDVQDDSLNPNGAGLGLAIVKKIITAHGGSIQLNTDHKRFEIRLNLPQM